MTETPLNAIVVAEAGSRVIGTANADSDRDLMGVFVEATEFVTGIESVDTQNLGTAEQGARSTASDTDQTMYPLRKWASLAARGNPTVLSLLFTPQDRYDLRTPAWNQLVEQRHLFISREAGYRFLGYGRGQRQALLGQRNKRTNRPELVHKYGYDTKFAYHMVRTVMQGVELMETTSLRLPMADDQLMILRAIRAGEIDKEQVLALADRTEDKLRQAIEVARLPRTADREGINRLLHQLYADAWAAA